MKSRSAAPSLLLLLCLAIPLWAQVLNVVELNGYRFATLDDTPASNRLPDTQTRSIGLPAGWAIADRSLEPTVPAAQSFSWGTECLVLADGSLVETQIGTTCTTFIVDDGTGLNIRPKNKRVLISQKIAVVSSVVPTFGSVAGGTIVTISGTGIGSGSDITSVTCGGILANIVSQTPDEVIVSTGSSNSPRVGDVSVSSTSRGVSSKASGFTFVLPPAVNQLVPNNGPLAGNSNVTVIGEHFGDIASINFATVAAKIVFQNATTIIATTGAASNSTTGPTVVTSPSIGSNPSNKAASYTYNPVGVISTVIPAEGPAAGANTVTITGTGLGSGTDIVSVSLNGVVARIISQTATAVVIAPGASVAGDGNVTVTSTSRGVASAAATIKYTYHPAGVITSVNPTVGPAAGTNVVSIIGTGLGSGNDITSVTLRGVVATIVNQTATSVTVTAGAGNTTSLNVAGLEAGDVIVNSTSRGSTNFAGAYKYNLAGAVSSVVPVSGPAAGGNLVTLTGTNFGNGSDIVSVRLANVEAVILSQNATDVVVRAAASPAVVGTVRITSTSFGVTEKTLAYTYNPVGIIASVIPNNGPLAGLNTLTVTGTNLGSGNDIVAVLIGNVPATIVSQGTNGMVITAGVSTVTGPQTVNVTSTSFGSALLPNGYTYNALGVISSVTPASGPASGLQPVTIIGSALGSGSDITSVSLAGIKATIVSQTATRIILTSAVASGPVVGNVTVESTSRGKAIKENGYTYNTNGVITSVVPNQAPTTGGTSVTITGTHLGNGTDITAVTLSTVPATIVSQSDTVIVVTTGVGRDVIGVNGVVEVKSPSEGTVSKANAFTYQAGVISSIIPNSGPAAGGNLVTIIGTSIGNGTDITSVKLSTVAATIVSQTVNQVIVRGGVSIAGTAGDVEVVSLSRGTTTLANSYTYLQAGTITSVTPATGPSAGNTIVTIAGQRLGSGSDITQVMVSGVAATIQSQSATQVVVVTGPGVEGPAGTVSVFSTTRGNTSDATFTYRNPAQVGIVSPNSGPVSGGTVVTITGTFLGSGSDVTSVVMNGVAATINSQTSTQIIVRSGVAPGPSAEPAPIQFVSTSRGSYTGGSFNYNAPGKITNVVPVSGPAVGGNFVTITGTDFGSATDTAVVSLAGSAASVVTYTTTRVIVTAAAGSGTGPVALSTNLRGAASGTFTYTYLPVGSVNTVTPSSGPVSGGNEVTIAGSNMGSGTDVTRVTLNGAVATIKTQSAGSIVVIAAAGTAGTGNVVVTSTSAGSMTGTNLYTYNGAGAITTLTPTSGPAAGGNTLTITGTNLGSGTDITTASFGTTGATIVSQTATSVVVTVPAGTGAVSVSVTSTSHGTSTKANAYNFLAAASITDVVPVSGPQVGGNSVTISGTVGSGSDVTSVTLAGTAATIVSQTTSRVVVTAAASTTAGAAGNVVLVSTSLGTATLIDSYTYTPTASVIDTVVPTSSPIAGGIFVTIAGVNLGSGSDVTSVTLAGVAAAIQSQTVNQVVVRTSPTGSAVLNGAVVVKSASKGSLTKDGSFTYSGGQVTSVSPPSGPAVGDTLLSIGGTGFTGATDDVTSVTVCGVSATIVSQSATLITVRTGVATKAGRGDVVITSTSQGTAISYASFTYIDGSIDSVAPTSGPSAGGNTVTITGTGLGSGTDITAVTLNNVPAAIISQTATSVVVTAGAGTGIGEVAVFSTSLGGHYKSSSYTYTASPGLDTITPNSCAISGGCTVSISGHSIGTNVVSVSLAGVSATIVSQSQISIVVTAGSTSAPVAGDVVVTSDNGVLTLAAAFSYTSDSTPSTSSAITSVIPASGPVAGSTFVTISGQNLGNGTDITSVVLDNIPATIQSQTADSVTVVTGAGGLGVGNVDVTSTSKGTTTKADAYEYTN